MPVDINRGTAGVVLPKSVSGEIVQTAIAQSAVMQVTPRTDLPGEGKTTPMILTDPVASWVLETDIKPISRPTVGFKNMSPYTIAVIVPFSNQFRRDANGLYNALVRRLPGALARRFDETVTGITAVPGTGFDTLGDAASLTLPANPTFAQVLAVVTAVSGAGGKLTDWLVSQQLYASLLGSVNANGQQFFTLGQGPAATLAPSIFGAAVVDTIHGFKSSTTVGDDLGIAGDFKNAAAYGIVESVTVSISDQASITDGGTVINLWERNMFAVRAEMEVGFAVTDKAKFRRLTDAVVDTP